MSQNWQIKKLSEICNLITDGVHNSPKYVESGIPMLDSKHIKDDFSIDDQNPTKFISQETDNLLSKRCKPLANDLLISSRGSIGKIAIVKKGQNFNIMGNIILLRVPNDVSSKYVAFSLQSKLDEIQAISRGVAQKGLYLNQVRNFKIALPPLPEQKRIVAFVDEAFEGIDRAIANAEKNLANARELFESYLNAIFTQKGDGWEEKKLGEVCQFENGDRGKNYPNREEYVESGIPWINTGHIQPNGTLSQSEMNFITQEKYESLRSGKIRQGDLVYCLRGATIGKTALVDPLTVGAVASSLVIIRPSNLLDSHFLYYFLTSLVGQRLIKLYDNGAAQPNLGAKSVAKYIIYLPNFAEQKVIVQNLVALAVKTQRLETIYRQKIAALNELKQSILQKAFTGELTADTANQTTKAKAAKEGIAA